MVTVYLYTGPIKPKNGSSQQHIWNTIVLLLCCPISCLNYHVIGDDNFVYKSILYVEKYFVALHIIVYVLTFKRTIHVKDCVSKLDVDPQK
jgi:hypothetical protein